MRLSEDNHKGKTRIEGPKLSEDGPSLYLHKTTQDKTRQAQTTTRQEKPTTIEGKTTTIQYTPSREKPSQDNATTRQDMTTLDRR